MAKQKYKFERLTPIDNMDLDVYEEAIDYVFSNSDVKNVAISGAYSAGKSSVLASYKKKHDELRFLHIQSILILLNLTDYLKIFDMRSRPKFEINNESEKLLAAFKECHLIDSYEESTTKAGYYKVARPKATKALSKEPSTVT